MANNQGEPLYKRPIGSAMGSCLLAVGVYTGTFESVVRLLRLAVRNHIEQTETDNRQRRLAGLFEASTAFAGLNFCAPYLLQDAIVTEEDIEFLQGVRRRRNQLVHEAIDRVFLSPRLADVTSDVRRMIDIAHAVEEWQKSYRPAPPAGMSSVDISYSGLLESCFGVAAELAGDHLDDNSRHK